MISLQRKFIPYSHSFKGFTMIIYTTLTFVTEVLYPVTTVQVLKCFVQWNKQLIQPCLSLVSQVFMENFILKSYPSIISTTSVIYGNRNHTTCLIVYYNFMLAVIITSWVHTHTHTHTNTHTQTHTHIHTHKHTYTDIINKSNQVSPAYGWSMETLDKSRACMWCWWCQGCEFKPHTDHHGFVFHFLQTTVDNKLRSHTLSLVQGNTYSIYLWVSVCWFNVVPPQIIP